VLTPFLDTYPGSVECGSARQGDGYWSAEELPMRAVADEKTLNTARSVGGDLSMLMASINHCRWGVCR